MLVPLVCTFNSQFPNKSFHILFFNNSMQNKNRNGGIKMNPYKNCPVYENENYLLRLVEMSDAPDLLLVYSDEKAVPYFNSDNCHGDDFHYTTPERMESAVGFWRMAYEQNAFVRWAVIDKRSQHANNTVTDNTGTTNSDSYNNAVTGNTGTTNSDNTTVTGIAVGTIELFNRQAKDFYHDCGLLRLDLRSDYENADSIREILSLIVPPAFDLFGCKMIATKIPPFAVSRKTAAEALGFTASEEKLIGGDDNREYGDYYILLK